MDWFPIGHTQHFFLVGKPTGTSTPYLKRDGSLSHRSDSRGALDGTVFVIGDETGNDGKARVRAAHDLFYQIEEYNHRFRYRSPDGGWVDELCEKVGRVAHARIGFRLYRTGELRLTPSVPENLPELSQELLCRHSYYFVRDCAHTHQHHRPQDDRLLPAIRVSTAGGQDDDTTWRREVLWALTRIVGQYRRNRSFAQRRQALGVMANADAFQTTLARIRRRDDDPEKHVLDESLATFDFAHQRASIEVANEGASWSRQGAFATAALTIATVMSVCSLWVATTRLASEQGWAVDSSWAVSLAEGLYRYPNYVLVVLVVAIWSVHSITYGPGRMSDPSEGWRRHTLALLLSGAPARRLRVRKMIGYFVLLIAISGIMEFQFGFISALRRGIPRLTANVWNYLSAW